MATAIYGVINASALGQVRAERSHGTINRRLYSIPQIRPQIEHAVRMKDSDLGGLLESSRDRSSTPLSRLDTKILPPSLT